MIDLGQVIQAVAEMKLILGARWKSEDREHFPFQPLPADKGSSAMQRVLRKKRNKGKEKYQHDLTDP